MNGRTAVTLALALTLAVATVARAQDGRYVFLGNYRAMERVKGGVVARAENGAVRIEQVADVGFRIRYSFTGAFDTAASWATLPDSIVLADPAIRETAEALTVRGAVLVATLRKHPLRLSIADTAGHELFSESLGAGHQGGRVTHIVARPSGGHYFGIGEEPFPLDRTGQILTMWNTDAGYHAGQTTPIYSSIPFYIAVNAGRAYGVFYDDSYKSEFDFGARLRSHVGFTADGGELRFYVFPGPAVESVLAEYTRLTGRTPLPPEWALGFQQSRWGYVPDSELYRITHEFRSRGIPCDVLYLDIDYMDGYRLFTWSPQRFPDPRRMLADLRREGMKVTTIVDVGVKVDSAYDVYRQLLASGDYVTWPDGSPYVGDVWPGKTIFPDFSRQATRTWWGEMDNRLWSAGIAGIWNDMNEPANFFGGTLPDVTLFGKGEHEGSHLEYHNLYGLLEARATYEGWRRLQPDHRPFIVTRAGFSGLQRYTSIWTGDNSADWEHLQLAVGMTLGLGISGVPFAGADIGGFAGSPSAELFSRFLEAATFFPFYRTHNEFSAPAREPWAFGPVHTAANREMIRLRYRLLPQLYTAFYQHGRDGRPVARPLVWEFQGDTAVYGINDEFTFGDHLLVAPVTREGQDTRPVYLPAGRWFRYPFDSVYDGGHAYAVSAPRVDPWARDDSNFVKSVPLFVQAGAVIPMQAVEQYVGERHMDTLELHVWDGGSGTSELYEDAGEGFAYRQGAFRLSRFQTTADGPTLRLAIAQTGSYAGAASSFEVVVHGLAAAPKSVTVDGRAAQAAWDAGRKLATLDVPATSKEIRIDR
ncbi:MAG TPA: TIM-barrel domain-containing protein [Gemmatimonadales bacterium]|nr:TIM-barrel domain-containing protein [Gemmatimonadales bacterium]